MTARLPSCVSVCFLVIVACGGEAVTTLNGSGGSSSGGASNGGGAASGGGGASGGGDSGGGGAGAATGELEGLYFMTLSLVLLPDMPIVFATTIVPTGNSSTVSLQPLSYEDRSTPVGVATVTTIPASSGFAFALPAWQIPGAANTLTGNDATLDVVFHSQPSSECGGVSGTTTFPPGINLDGSTFTLTPITDIARAPEPPPIDCRGNLADPLPSP